jgi:hypothetical protein
MGSRSEGTGESEGNVIFNALPNKKRECFEQFKRNRVFLKGFYFLSPFSQGKPGEMGVKK